MSTSCFHKNLKRTAGLLAIVSALCVLLFTRPLQAEDTVIFLDPGHGGQDTGARGTGGLLEKDVTLALAKKIKEKLDPKYSVRFSRNDDYRLDLFHRTETANSQKAEIFICLHTGGAFNYSSGGFTIYYYLDSPGRVLPENPSDEPLLDQTTGRIPWHSVQYRHAGESRNLSQFLQVSLSGVSGSSGCRMVGAPLLALSAADMPAVLIEIGCLNNPAEEEELTDPAYLDSLAEAIRNGLDNYLGRSSGITSIDLHE